MKLVKRNWGYYLTIFDRKQFKVKLLRFGYEKSCSLQYHIRRNELWLMLSGRGHMDTEQRKDGVALESGEWFNIPAGEKHKFTATCQTWVLEIQYGSKCVEEDIMRLS